MDAGERLCELDFVGIFEDLEGEGVSFVSSALSNDFLTDITEEVRKAPFKRAPEREGVVKYQELYSCDLQEGELFCDPHDYPLTFSIRNLLQSTFTEFASIFRCNFRYTLNLNSIQLIKYPKNSRGLGKHRDYKRNKNLILIFTLQGHSRFHLFGSREDSNPKKTYEVSSGDLVVLRAPGFMHTENGRPYHNVEGSEDERYVTVFRQLEKPL